MSLTKEQMIGHVLRRLGLGASYAEMEFYSKLGVDGTIDRLVNYEKVPESFDIDPTTFSAKNRDGKVVLRMPTHMGWWTLRLWRSSGRFKKNSPSFGTTILR
ncbi:MAG: hypothetical protein ACR2HJ_02625 [Fimbriimonadales bacterium]